MTTPSRRARMSNMPANRRLGGWWVCFQLTRADLGIKVKKTYYFLSAIHFSSMTLFLESIMR